MTKSNRCPTLGWYYGAKWVSLTAENLGVDENAGGVTIGEDGTVTVNVECDGGERDGEGVVYEVEDPRRMSGEERKQIADAASHAQQIADSYADTAPDCQCAAEHRKLAGWLYAYLWADERIAELESMLDEASSDALKWSLEVVDLMEEVEALRARLDDAEHDADVFMRANIYGVEQNTQRMLENERLEAWNIELRKEVEHYKRLWRGMQESLATRIRSDTQALADDMDSLKAAMDSGNPMGALMAENRVLRARLAAFGDGEADSGEVV